MGQDERKDDRKDGRKDERRAAAGQAVPVAADGWYRVDGSSPVYRGRSADNSQAWLLTFTDLSALMLTFFVLLFSMSTIKDSDWQNLVDSLSPRLDRLQQVTIALPQSEKTAEAVERLPGTDLDYLAAVLKEQLAADPLLAQVRIAHVGPRLVISVPGDLLFASGATDLGEAGEKSIFALAGILRNLRNVIEIAGHADPVPSKGAYPTNWELSLARAAVLSGMLSKVGYKGEILVRGYGHAHYEELDPSLAPETRMALARRVDIIVHAYASETR
ncbi:MAG: flagellar motor protein MotB [Kiloniellaceae bacterium]